MPTTTWPAPGYDELINNEKVDAILGAAASGTTKAVIDRIVSSGTVRVLAVEHRQRPHHQAEDKGLYFRTPPPDNLQAQALAKVAQR